MTRSKKLVKVANAGVALVAVAACGNVDQDRSPEQPRSSSNPEATMQQDTAPHPVADEDEARLRMVETQIAARGIEDLRVLHAMRKVPRHEFVPKAVQHLAYEDFPLPIGEQQTISQPYIVAYMTQLIEPRASDRVLEVGTGSGYQAAILGELVEDVYTIEIVEPLARQAKETLERLGYKNVHVRSGDGYRGWPERGPFDAIVVTAAAPTVPKPLLEQLVVGGRLVIPVGERSQELLVVTRTESGFREQKVLPVRFVPMTGRAQEE